MLLSIDDVSLQQRMTEQLAMNAAQHRGHVEAREPIVLVHGMAGFRPLGTWYEYFYQVMRRVTADGYSIFAAQTDPFQTIDYRARQLAVQVDAVLQATGAARVHLVAHSQGGLDARYLISTLGYGDRVATLVTVGTPHHGVRAVDVALRLLPKPVARSLTSIVNALGNALLGGRADLMAQLGDVSEDFVQRRFNPNNPDDPRVRYYAYSGITQVSAWVHPKRVDVVNPGLLPTYELITLTDGDNDGIVGTDSARWGIPLGVLAADHWDEIGQIPGTPHLAFQHLDFYRRLARFLNGA
ncbi:MAG TPA: alpha/beta fold hydrolase, partial [Myxococcota bacterium]|nr:alpha/beta fold hydrolase [Myxococcota bacterium]